jgi:hypothetical protein
MRYLLPLLLGLTICMSVEARPRRSKALDSTICRDISIELIEAVELRIITKDEAADILSRCYRSQ